MYADTQFELLVRSMSYLEVLDGVQQGERHACDLPTVQLPVPHRQTRHHHVGVADCLHLWTAGVTTGHTRLTTFTVYVEIQVYRCR